MNQKFSKVYEKRAFQDMSHGIQGWVDWNLVLDPQVKSKTTHFAVDFGNHKKGICIKNSTRENFEKKNLVFSTLINVKKVTIPIRKTYREGSRWSNG